MLIDHRGSGARMAEASHQLFEAGAGRGSHRSTHVPEIMEVKARHASLITCRVPDWAEV
jgi:hypothetical protein